MQLQVKNLNISFEQYQGLFQRRRVHVVHDLNLEVREREVMAIFGASGSGKSLLAHAILGLLPYNARVEGEIFYQGILLDAKRRSALYGREIAFIPQTVKSLNPLLRVGKASALTTSPQRVKEVYAAWGLGPEVYSLYPHQLSGGMLRRVLVSDAILSDASFLIADEPTPGMDVESLRLITDFFRGLKSQGKSALLITHDMEMALRCADRISIFYGGTIIEVAHREQFVGQGEKLLHPYSRALFQALPEQGFRAPQEGELC